MPSYDELDNEAAWRAEIEPPGLLALKAGIKAWRPAAGVGIRGDDKHTSGYHRSRRWIRESRFCTNRTYSVSRTAGDRSGGDENWACGVDVWGLPQAELLAMCARLDEAVRAGLLEKLTEWYGNVDGDGRVDGYDNIANRVASSDSSHLTHLHMSFDRGRANEDHSDLLAVLTGIPMEVNMFTAQIAGNSAVWLSDGIRHRPVADYPTLQRLQGIGVRHIVAPNADALRYLIGDREVDGPDPVTLAPEQLAAMSTAAATGAEAGVAKGADELVAAFIAALPDDVASRDDVVSALREVLGSARIVVPAE